MRAPLPTDERERLAALRAYHILDTAPEQSFDDLTLLASQICGTPISAISLIDEQRQWFKSIIGLDVRETPRDQAFCAHTILDSSQLLIVPDATRDPRFSDNALVLGEPNIRFYAGMPLVTFAGEALGSLCVIDRTPRVLSPGQLEALRVLGRQVVYQFELRRAHDALHRTVGQLRQTEADLRNEQYKQLELRDQLVSHVSHELRSPLTVIYQYATILHEGLAGPVNERQREFLDITLKNALQLQRMIGDLIDMTRAGTGKLALDRRRVSMREIVSEIAGSLAPVAAASGIELRTIFDATLPDVLGDPGRLRQVIVNLVDNGIKFTPTGGSITVRLALDPEEPGVARVTVEDTGSGISVECREHIFDRLYQVNKRSKVNRKGLGLGLYLCRDLVTRQGGRLWVESEPGQGSRFHFTVPLFDLATLLAPVLTPDNFRFRSLALLRIQVLPPAEGGAVDTHADPIGAAWNTVTACTNPAMDIVLPRLGEGDQPETIIVVAMADESGAKILEQRIEQQLGACAEAKANGYAWEQLATTLLVLPDERVQTASGSVAASIAAMIDPHLDNTSWAKAA